MLVFPSDEFLECHTPEMGDVSELAVFLLVRTCSRSLQEKLPEQLRA